MGWKPSERGQLALNNCECMIRELEGNINKLFKIRNAVLLQAMEKLDETARWMKLAIKEADQEGFLE